MDKICEKCGLNDEWNGEKLVLQLDHIDGDSTNHKFENLRILCPNCHSQTETYGSKNKKIEKTYNKIELLKAISESKTYSEVKRKIGLKEGGDYNIIKNILFEYNVKFIDKDTLKNIYLEEIELEKNKIIIQNEITQNKKKRICHLDKHFCKCGKEIQNGSAQCEVCYKISIRKVKDRPPKEILLEELSKSNYTMVGKKYGVSDNTIRKWLK